MIQAKLVTGTCAFCCRDRAPVRDPDDVEPMVMLMRALIRFYWDEFDYNSHWGGDSAVELFADAANPVIAPPVCDTYRDEFHFLLEEPAYPDPDKGIAIYAGFDERDSRQAHVAISRSNPPTLRHLANRLLSEDFPNVAPALEVFGRPFPAGTGVYAAQGNHRVACTNRRRGDVPAL
jgi:hypothetical protein